jgi:hypothetical protein
VKRFALFLALGVLGICRGAYAQTDEFGSYVKGGRRGESSQDAAVELRFGQYVPNIDKSVPGAPYQDVFGSSNRYIFGMEGDWQLIRFPHLGTLGPGLGWGYTRATGNARITATGEPSAEETALSVMPFYLVGVLRADVLARELNVPIVPYAKLGIGYALWWASDGGVTSRENGVLGRGVSYGPQYAIGAMFLLDELDQQTARDADNSLGINHSYIFGELYNSNLSGFGSNSRLDVGTSSWVLGLALEF